MKTTKLPIRICMGSSCYSRGNDHVLERIKSFLKDNNLEDKVDFRGHLCQGNCNKGPNLSIGDSKYHEVSASNINMILDDAFKKNMV